MVYLILAGSYTSSISTLAFDPVKGSLDLDFSTTVGHHPSWITFYPGDHSLVFTGLEQADGKILALKYSDEGKGEVVATAESGGSDPCSLIAMDKPEVLFVANYSSGTVTTLPISRSAPYILASSPSATIQLTGSGPNTSRQEKSHPHQVFIRAHEAQLKKELLVPDLGTDRVQRYIINADGALVHMESLEYQPGSGPRHVAVHDNHLFTLHELSSMISKHSFPPSSILPLPLALRPTLSKPPQAPHSMLAAEILVPPSSAAFPKAYIYVSNRNDPDPEGDTIAIFEPGKMEMVGEVRTGLKHLRGMSFGGEDNKWLVAGGAQGGGVKIFERVDGGKGLKEIAKNEEVEAPTAFLWK